jgi:hypothetical protein
MLDKLFFYIVYLCYHERLESSLVVNLTLLATSQYVKIPHAAWEFCMPRDN